MMMMISARVGVLTAALSVLAGACHAGASLSFYNSGPSGAAVPSSANANVATIRFPREIVNPDVPYALPSNLFNGSLSVQTQGDETTGVRWRSVATIAFFDTNPNASFEIAANLNFNPRASESSIVFLNEASAAQISTLGQFDAFLASPGAQFVLYSLSNAGFGLTDADLIAANLRAGVLLPVSDLSQATPDFGPANLLNPGAAGNFPVAIVVLANGANRTPTEWIRVQTSPRLVEPSSATFRFDARTLRLGASMQLVDDAPEHPGDTNPSALDGTDFRLRINGAGPALLLQDFLTNTLSTPRSISGGAVSGDFRDTLLLTLDAPITDPGDLSLIANATIGFTTGFGGGRVFSHAGHLANGMVTSFLPIVAEVGCPAPANADTNGDGVINFVDLNTVLGSFGQTGFGSPGDVNLDGVVNFSDLNAVLAAFGVSCP